MKVDDPRLALGLAPGEAASFDYIEQHKHLLGLDPDEMIPGWMLTELRPVQTHNGQSSTSVTAGPHEDHNDGGDGGRPPSQATQLVGLAEGRYRIGQSERGEPFGVPHSGPNVARMLRGDAASLRAELAAAYTAQHGKPPSAQALADALLVLEGRAQQTDREPVALRVARHHGQVVVDLGGADGRAATVDPAGWRVEPSPVLFRRSPLTDPLPEPDGDGDLAELWRLLNVAEADRPLIAAWLVVALLADRPAPVLLLTGEQGTAKTTAGKLLAGLVDSADALRAPPRDVEGWIVAADASRVVGIDNLSSVPAWLSDAVCRTVTGEALVRRKLYTDGAVTRVALRRPVLLTAIDTGGLRGDLADRLLTVELERIPDRQRLLDADVDRRWRDAHPRVLGGLLTLTSQVLAALPHVALDAWPRMADYARILAAVDRVQGTAGLARYVGQRDRLAEEVIDGDPVAAAVRDLVSPEGGEPTSWEGSANELLTELTTDERHKLKGWPATPRGMAGALRRVAPSLRRVGIAVDTDERTSRSRRWTLDAREGVTDRHNRHDRHSPDVARDLAMTVDDGRPSQPSSDRHHEAAGHDGDDGHDGPSHASSGAGEGPCPRCGTPRLTAGPASTPCAGCLTRDELGGVA